MLVLPSCPQTDYSHISALFQGTGEEPVSRGRSVQASTPCPGKCRLVFCIHAKCFKSILIIVSGLGIVLIQLDGLVMSLDCLMLAW